ncbi:DUF4232 domain-containing protein [Nocardia sp. NPDC059240]|uniref:DUF4232 domain-containing protein n=1 Tax=Nocardia sp. NPDC059240 TaxID=3346786 RepID=UPI0036A4D6B8
MLALAGCGNDKVAAPQSTIPAADRCHAADLSVRTDVVSAGQSPSVDHVIAEIRVTNTAARTCLVQGYPALRLRDRTGAAHDAAGHRTGAVAERVSLPPGAIASSTLDYDGQPSVNAPVGGCPEAVALLVSVPDETGELVAPMSYDAPLVCKKRPVGITPLVAAVYHADTAPSPVSPCRTADLTFQASVGGHNMSREYFSVKITNRGEHDCVIGGYGPGLQLVDANHNLQYPDAAGANLPPGAPGVTVLPAGSTGVMTGNYTDGAVCNKYGLDESPVPTAYLRATVPGDPATVDVPYSAKVYCGGGFGIGRLVAY